MGNKESTEGNPEKLSHLNEVFEDLVSDASDLIKDLYAGVRNYLFFGLVATLFGIGEIASNVEMLQERLYIPLFVGGCLLFAGAAQIVQYFRLRKKYSKLFAVQADLKRSSEN